MLSLITIVLLLVLPLVMLILRTIRPRFAFTWLLAAAGVLLAWPMVLLSGMDLPQIVPLGQWQPVFLFPVSPALLIDSISWPFALAVVSIALAVILTDFIRTLQGDQPAEASWLSWAAVLVLAALGLLAVQAASPLSLLLAWAALDIMELLILLVAGAHREEPERLVASFSSRAASIVLVLWASILAQTPGTGVTFAGFPPEISPYFLVAAVLRLGVVPLRSAAYTQVARPLERGLGTMLSLVSAASGLILLVRTASVGVLPGWESLLLVLAGLGALYGSLIWVLAPDEISGRPAWVLALTGLVLGSAVRGETAAALAWSIALLLSGGLLFLYSARRRFLLVWMLLGLAGFSTLPFTPAWFGVELYSPPFQLVLLLFLPAHALLLLGYLRHMLRFAALHTGAERWVWVLYPFGLAFLPLSHFYNAYWTSPGGKSWPELVVSWPGAIAVGLAGLLVYLQRRGLSFPFKLQGRLGRDRPLQWLVPLARSLYQSLGRFIALLNLVFEGEGGFLWTLLLLTLLISYLMQSGLGG